MMVTTNRLLLRNITGRIAGSILLSIADDNTFIAIHKLKDFEYTIAGIYLEESHTLVGSTIRPDGIVGAVLMQKTKLGYRGAYTYIDGTYQHYNSKCEWLWSDTIS